MFCQTGRQIRQPPVRYIDLGTQADRHTDKYAVVLRDGVCKWGDDLEHPSDFFMEVGYEITKYSIDN